MPGMRAVQSLGTLLLLWLTTCAARPSTSVPPVNQPLAGPETALERYAEAFRSRSPDGIGAVLAADYRFHAIGDSLATYAVGSDRSREMAVVRSLLLGVVRDGVTVMPAPDSVGIWFDGISGGVDPEHPDSAQHYQTLTVTRANFGIRLPGGQRMFNAPTTHVFQVVRGDAARLEPGQAASPDLWYIRRWLEDVSGVRNALAERHGDCGEPPAPAPGPRSSARAPAPSLVLAVRPLANPACAVLAVTCDLPGAEPARVEVYDVSGRLVNRRDVPVAGAGTLTVEAGKGARILPGVYWVRLGQAARRPSTQMVVVAR